VPIGCAPPIVDPRKAYARLPPTRPRRSRYRWPLRGRDDRGRLPSAVLRARRRWARRTASSTPFPLNCSVGARHFAAV